MCGLIGTLGFIPEPQWRKAGLAALHRRGPDGASELCGADFWIGHVLLSVRDRAPLTATQPAVDGKRRLALVYNGEIYGEGEAPLSAGEEARVLTGAARLAMYGTCADLDRLHGDYALAIVEWGDHGAWHRALIGRDRTGVKPLYVVRHCAGWAFASSLKALVAAGLVQTEVNPDAVALYLRFGSVPQPLTMLAGVVAVIPGERRILHPEGGASRTVAQPTNVAPTNASFAEQAKRSVAMQCADVIARGDTMHVFLSGGIDSALLAHFGLQAGARVRGRCVRITGSPLDESSVAVASAAALGIPLDVVEIEETLLATRAMEFLSATDQPTIDGLNSFLVFTGASFDERVVFTGTGLDELYFGYRWMVDILRDAGTKSRSLYGLAADWERRTSYVSATEIASLTGRSVPGTLDDADPGPGRPLHDRLRAICLRRFTADRLLRDLDDVAMHHRKEARVPFLGSPLLANAVGMTMFDLFPRGLDGDEANYLTSPLKQSVVDAAARLVPNILVMGRRKQGFVLPLDQILCGRLAEHVSWALSPRSSPAAHLLDIERLCGLAHTERQGGIFIQWMVLVLSVWLVSLREAGSITGSLTLRSVATHNLTHSSKFNGGQREAFVRS